ncbi:hypothetical protein BpHYR1_045781 [Brachionus plicatilis]|uniref:Uncharacterized protein n=1 Tax=Brachionus plicatilis TaxID=10195 RepID=A0A3M7RE93_BRAPC|nr:hypothetical protein BpHYR1_045781 [Brachionus plicatilis]
MLHRLFVFRRCAFFLKVELFIVAISLNANDTARSATDSKEDKIALFIDLNCSGIFKRIFLTY